MTVFELLKEAPQARRRDPVDYRLTLVEIHKKFSIPFACLAFGIIALPLGITNRRGGKSSGFSLSILIILVYYILINNGEDLARSGKLPAWLAMWAPTHPDRIRDLPSGRANSDRSRHPLPSLLSRLGTWLAHFAVAKTAERRGRRRNRVLRRLDIAFPNTLDATSCGVLRFSLSYALDRDLFLIVDTPKLGELTRTRFIRYRRSYYRSSAAGSGWDSASVGASGNADHVRRTGEKQRITASRRTEYLFTGWRFPSW